MSHREPRSGQCLKSRQNFGSQNGNGQDFSLDRVMRNVAEP